MEQETGIVTQQQQPQTSMTLKQVADRVNLVHQVLDKVLKKGTHYGTIDGCGDKKVLFKPGADVLAMTFRLVPQFMVTKTELGNGHREYDVTCSMYGPSGELLGQGVGSATTMEKKYRYRWEGTGENRKRIENEDIADVHNTVLKMAKKRAHVDATLTVTGAADLFTQDLIEEQEEGETKAPVTMPQAKSGGNSDTNTAQAPPAKSASGANVAQGILATVTTKTGENKRGPWVSFRLKIGGEWYGTFDRQVGELAESIQGERVYIEWREDGKYKTVTDISLLGEAPPPIEVIDIDDDLPYDPKPPTAAMDEEIPF